MKYWLVLIVMLPLVTVCSQEYMGTTGLLNVPSAETAEAGTFRGGGMFLDKRFTPDMMKREGQKYNTFTYFIGLTAWEWIEVAYGGALLKIHKNRDKNEPVGYYNEDRRLNVKLRPLKEGKWWPALAVGCDDIGRFSRVKTSEGGNDYFQNFYAVGSKHFDLSGNELGAHLAYRFFSSELNKRRRGLAGGITFRPSFYKSLRLVAEWDGSGVNAGADVLLWRHLFVQAALVHGRGFTGGMSYHYTIKF